VVFAKFPQLVVSLPHQLVLENITREECSWIHQIGHSLAATAATPPQQSQSS
jgi:hypothetical protein